MSSLPKVSALTRWVSPRVRVDVVLVFFYQMVAVMVVAITPMLATRWLSIAPSGAFVELNLVVDASNRWTYIYLPYLIGVAYLLTSLWVFSLRRHDAAGQLFALFSASVAIVLASLFDAFTTYRLTQLRTLAMALAGGALIHLSLVFPREASLSMRFGVLRYLSYLPVGLLVLFGVSIPDKLIQPDLLVVLYSLFLGFFFVSIIFMTGCMVFNRIRSPSPIIQEQSRLILLGIVIAFCPLIVWTILRIARPDLIFSTYLLLPLVVFPLFLGYAILRYRMLNTDYLLSRAVLYGLLTLLVASGYAILVSGFSLIIEGTLLPSNPYLVGLVIFILALCLNPLRLYLQKRVDEVFFRGKAIFQEQLQSFSRELTETSDYPLIIQLVRAFVDEALQPYPLHLYLFDEYGTHYSATGDERGQLTSEIRFAASSPLAQALSRRHGALYFEGENSLPPHLNLDRARLALLDAQLFVPLPGRERLTGWLALGPRRSGEVYSSESIDYLEALCDQASLALERSLVVAVLERRVREMDIITRVSEGINVTLAFDDLLEMFHTQTNRLIPTQDFRITLGDEHGQEFYHVFFLENNERLPSREYKAIALGIGLETDVVRCRRSIVTDDYDRECHNRGILPDAAGLFAWIGIPLNAGKETIGAVCLGSRDPAIAFTSDQVNLLQAIADLVAGAIVKARLLDESQRRARQLASLNQVTRGLTSTLELDPLLQQILRSAVEILDCETGSLLLVDEQTGESVFTVVLGPVAQDLIGKRLPPGIGLVGKSVKSRQGIIQNEVQNSEDWFNTDVQTGFTSKDLLVVPMLIKDRVIGVLEVLNKNNRSPFTWDDLELISAFAGQAAVAMENARLYTLTDKALNERVEELSVLQRIAHDLNADLDLERVMQLTLDWAMIQSKATAGLVGILEESGVRVMAWHGYPSGALPTERDLLPLDLPVWGDALQEPGNRLVSSDKKSTGRLHRRAGSSSQVSHENGRDIPGLLTGGKAGVVVPIQREDRVLGAILVETASRGGFTSEIQAFLTRLSDQAAIAISNAQLYTGIQTVNIAKSQFVSSAAHELKNPLTSIKGYSDLLVGGAVGPVNEGQARFLGTIRSNAERMSTLVSDLQDISRIEAGQMRLQYSAVVVSEVIDEVVRSLRKQIDEKEQALHIQYTSNLPPVWCDSTRLIQILTNLLSNACKYTPRQGEISIQAQQVLNQWDADGVGQVVHFSMQDSGAGISLEDQKKIFQQFFRSEDPRIREVTGTGLGLSITKNLIEMQGGKLWFESIPDQGTTFHFTIPVAETE